jgi:hypothetical protein
VGLNVLPADHHFHEHVQEHGQVGTKTYQSQLSGRDVDARTVTEQDLRTQLGLRPRAGYER